MCARGMLILAASQQTRPCGPTKPHGRGILLSAETSVCQAKAEAAPPSVVTAARSRWQKTGVRPDARGRAQDRAHPGPGQVSEQRLPPGPRLCRLRGSEGGLQPGEGQADPASPQLTSQAAGGPPRGRSHPSAPPRVPAATCNQWQPPTPGSPSRPALAKRGVHCAPLPEALLCPPPLPSLVQGDKLQKPPCMDRPVLPAAVTTPRGAAGRAAVHTAPVPTALPVSQTGR